jgi:hypothetical protein
MPPELNPVRYTLQVASGSAGSGGGSSSTAGSLSSSCSRSKTSLWLAMAHSSSNYRILAPTHNGSKGAGRPSPLVAVVVPAYIEGFTSAAALSRLVASLAVSQSRPPDGVIVVDDLSPTDVSSIIGEGFLPHSACCCGERLCQQA